MIDFITSISPLGWLIIAVVVAVLLNLKRLFKGGGKSRLPEHKMQPGEDPPIFRPPRSDG